MTTVNSPRIEAEEVLDRDELNGGLDEIAQRLWRRAVRSGTWDPAAIDFTEDRKHYVALDPDRRAYLDRFAAAFFRAEATVARVFGPWVMAAPTFSQQAFLSSQLFEEYKHTDFFEIAFRDVFGHEPDQALANPVHEPLPERGERLLALLDRPGPERDAAWVEAVAHYQGVVEGVQANAGYQIFRRVFADKGLFPGLSEGYANIQRDEGRHVGFGIAVLRHHAAADRRLAERIRAVFAEYLPIILARYGQSIVVDGREVPPPPEERGPEQLVELYNRRLRDIFGPDVAQVAVPSAVSGGTR
jgi:ribonucleoside-diphosphate reductase beta chain